MRTGDRMLLKPGRKLGALRRAGTVDDDRSEFCSTSVRASRLGLARMIMLAIADSALFTAGHAAGNRLRHPQPGRRRDRANEQQENRQRHPQPNTCL